MHVDTKFNFEDRPFLINQERAKRWVVCGFCAGSGSINGASGEKRSCPECYNRKGTYEYFELKWAVSRQLTVGQIRFSMTAAYDAGDDDTVFDNYGSQKYKREVEYMMRETGIGSGSLWREGELFATEEEAQAECDKRNAKVEASNA